MEVLELDEPVETLEPLLFCINPMLEQIILRAQLHAVALAAISITLWLQQECDRTLGEEEQTAAAISTPIAISKSAPNSADQPLYPKIALRSAAPRHPRKELPLVESTGKPRMPTKTAPLPTPIRSKSAPSSNPLPALAQADPGKQIAFVRTIRPAVCTIDRPLLLKMLKLDLEAHPPSGAVVRILAHSRAW